MFSHTLKLLRWLIILPLLQTANAFACELELSLIARETERQLEFEQTGALLDGTDLRFKVSSQDECELALFWKDASGEVFNLMAIDNPKKGSFRLFRGDSNVLPGVWLTLEPGNGRETILLVGKDGIDLPLAQIGLILSSADTNDPIEELRKLGLETKVLEIAHQVSSASVSTRIPPRDKMVDSTEAGMSAPLYPFRPELGSGEVLDTLLALTDADGGALRGSNSALVTTAAKSVVYIFHSGATGSGVVVDADRGLIVTNHHVVDGAQEVGVVFSQSQLNSARSQRSYVASVVKANPSHDLALLMLRARPDSLNAMGFGDVSKLALGMEVHAIGHPLGFRWTYTRGYISQIRPNYFDEDFNADVIQSQTPISPGNSGGPLFTGDGMLVGINTFGYEEGQGLNFAVSARHVIDLLKMTSSDRTNPEDVMKIRFSSPATAKEFYDIDGNGRADLYCFDTDRNGVVDMCAVDENEDSEAEYWLLDLNENREPDGSIQPAGDGYRGYVWWFDQNEDGKDEVLGHDENSDGKIDRYVIL